MAVLLETQAMYLASLQPKQTEDSPMAAHFEIKKQTNGQFMFNLKAGNGEIILTSDIY